MDSIVLGEATYYVSDSYTMDWSSYVPKERGGHLYKSVTGFAGVSFSLLPNQ